MLWEKPQPRGVSPSVFTLILAIFSNTGWDYKFFFSYFTQTFLVPECTSTINHPLPHLPPSPLPLPSF